MVKLTEKEQDTFNALREPTHKGCWNCKNYEGDSICSLLIPDCDGYVEFTTNKNPPDSSDYEYTDVWLSKWEWNGK